MKEEEREFEKLTYSRDMFWNEPEKQRLIEKLLQKIYDLEDKLVTSTRNKKYNYEQYPRTKIN